MKLIFTDRETYRDKRTCYQQYFAADRNTYFIDEGGASEEAVNGCAELIAELPAATDHIFCAAGTGTTAAGLLRGILKAQLHTTLHVVPVLKGGDFIRDEIIKYTGSAAQLIVHTDYHFGGYAKTQPRLLAFMKQFIATQGILIDPVYTAKMCFAVQDLADQQYFKSDERIVAIHSGGLLGIMGMKDKLSASAF